MRKTYMPFRVTKPKKEGQKTAQTKFVLRQQKFRGFPIMENENLFEKIDKFRKNIQIG